jgi:hypothetical protein
VIWCHRRATEELIRAQKSAHEPTDRYYGVTHHTRVGFRMLINDTTKDANSANRG